MVSNARLSVPTESTHTFAFCPSGMPSPHLHKYTPVHPRPTPPDLRCAPTQRPGKSNPVNSHPETSAPSPKNIAPITCRRQSIATFVFPAPVGAQMSIFSAEKSAQS
jgi:hypothetical protein